MNVTSAVTFSGERRIHMGLSVQNITQSVEFYSVLFGQRPTKLREGYAKFEVETPSVNLALNQVTAGAKVRNPHEFHFGIQMKSTEAVSSAIRHFSEANLEMVVEEGVNCCYAVQNKVWVADPDGNKWEVFVVVDADAEKASGEMKSECCVRTRGSDSCVS